jgi:hypothetical protein
MKKFLIAAAVLSIAAGSAFAQAGTAKGTSNDSNPPASASSNDMSKNPDTMYKGKMTKHSSKKKMKKKKHHSNM